MNSPRAELAAVIRYGRKRAGLSQVALAKSVGVTQGTISKVESGILSVDVSLWFDICDLLKIPYDCHRSGQIDSLGCDLVSATNGLGRFQLPRRYSEFAGSTARTLLPFLKFFESRVGKKTVDAYLKTKKIDPDYLVQLSNPINVRIIADTLLAMCQQKILDPANLPELASHFSSLPIHGPYLRIYEGMTPFEVMTTLLQHLPEYEKNFDYRVESVSENSAFFSTRPHPHVEELGLDPEAAQMLCHYRGSALHQFVGKYGKVKNVTSTERECVYHGGSRCLHEVQIAN